MADDEQQPGTPKPVIVPPTGEATQAAATTGSPVAGQTARAPPTGANRPATPHHTAPTPAAPAVPAAARPPPAAPGAPAAAPPATAAPGAPAAARPAPAARPAAAPPPDFAGKTTTIASP